MPKYGVSGEAIPAYFDRKDVVRTPQLPRTRGCRRPPCSLVDRPKLRRPAASGRPVERRPSTVGSSRRPEAGARTVRRCHAEPRLGEDDGRDHIRRTRRLLRPRPAAGRRGRRVEHSQAMAPAYPRSSSRPGSHSDRSRRRSSITPRSSRRSSPASAARPRHGAGHGRSRPCRGTPRRAAAAKARPASDAAGEYQQLIDQTRTGA